MSNIFLAFFAGIDNNNKIPVFYESFINELQKLGHKVNFVRHANFGTQEWGGAYTSKPSEVA